MFPSFSHFPAGYKVRDPVRRSRGLIAFMSPKMVKNGTRDFFVYIHIYIHIYIYTYICIYMCARFARSAPPTGAGIGGGEELMTLYHIYIYICSLAVFCD